MRRLLPGLFVLLGSIASEAGESPQIIEFSPQIVLDGTGSDIFQWKAGSEAIRADEQANRESLAQHLIRSGNWQRLIAEFASTHTARTAIKNLDAAGLQLLPDGRIISQDVFVTTVPITR